MCSKESSFIQLNLLGNITTCAVPFPPTLSQAVTGQRCIKCNEVKALSSFDVYQTGGGIRNTCKTCRAEMSQLRSKLRKLFPPPPPGSCPICGNHTTTWILDHCHTTDSFRGYICDRCNRGLGCFGDDPERVLKALTYLSTSRYATKDQVQNTTYQKAV